MMSEKLLALDSVVFVPMRRTSVLLAFSWRKLCVNQVFISKIQSVRDVGGIDDEGLVVR